MKDGSSNIHLKSGGSFRSILGALEEQTEVLLLVLPFKHGHLDNSKKCKWCAERARTPQI